MVGGALLLGIVSAIVAESVFETVCLINMSLCTCLLDSNHHSSLLIRGSLTDDPISYILICQSSSKILN